MRVIRLNLCVPACLTAAPDRDESAGPASSPGQKPAPQQGGPFRGVGSAYVLLGATLVGVGIGLAVDRWLGSAPKALITCSILFIGAGLYQVVKESQR